MLKAIEIEGFKSFREHAFIGPLGPLTAVVGPNGVGKSVVGEAIAFALGGNKKMLRAKALSALANNERRAAGNSMAQVTLHLAPTSSPGHPTSACAASSAGSAAGITAMEAAPPLDALRVRRTLRGDQCSIHVSRGDATAGWKAVSQAGLQQVLSDYGIQTEVIDRYVVTQMRHAVDVSDPVRLAKHLEVLIGTDGYEQLIGNQDEAMQQLGVQMDALDQEAAALETQRSQLAPMVQCWREHQEASEALRRRKRALLSTQLQELSAELAGQEAEAKEAQAAEAAAALEAAAAEQGVRRLKAQLCQLDRRMASAQSEHSSASSQACKLSVEADEAKAAASAAEAAAESDASLRAKLKSRLVKLAAQREQLASSCSAQQQEEAKLQQALDEARAALEGLLPAGADGRTDDDVLAAAKAKVAASEAQLAQATAKQARRAAAADAAAAKAAAASKRLRQGEAARSNLEQQLQHELEAQQVATAGVAEVQQAQQAAAGEWQVAQKVLLAVQHNLADKQAQFCSLTAATAARGASRSGPATQSPDEAVAALAQLSQQGQLPGKFFGRLCNVAEVTEGAALPAVNAALQEVVNLAANVVVSDRQTAAAVVAHFKEHRVGTVTCRILQELPPARPSTLAAASAMAAAAARPLASLLRSAPGVGEVQPLLEQLLGSWWLVDDRRAALRLRQAAPGRAGGSLVTLQGEVFKADGEIVTSSGSGSGGGSKGKAGKYLLNTAVQPLLSAPQHTGTGTGGGRGGSRRGQAHSGAEEGQEEHTLEQLKQQLEQLHDMHGAASTELAKKERRLVAADNQLAAAHKCAAQAAAAAAAARRKLASHQQQTKGQVQLREQVEVALTAQRAAAAALEASCREQEEQQASLVQLQQEYEAARTAHNGCPDLMRAEQQLAAAAAAVAAAKAAQQGLSQQQRKLANQATAVQSELSALPDPKQQQTKQKRLHSKLKNLSSRATHQQEKASAAAEQLAAARQEAAAAKKALQVATMAQDVATAALSAAQARKQRAAAAVASARQQRERLQEQLQAALAAPCLASSQPAGGTTPPKPSAADAAAAACTPGAGGTDGAALQGATEGMCSSDEEVPMSHIKRLRHSSVAALPTAAAAAAAGDSGTAAEAGGLMGAGGSGLVLGEAAGSGAAAGAERSDGDSDAPCCMGTTVGRRRRVSRLISSSSSSSSSSDDSAFEGDESPAQHPHAQGHRQVRQRARRGVKAAAGGGALSDEPGARAIKTISTRRGNWAAGSGEDAAAGAAAAAAAVAAAAASSRLRVQSWIQQEAEAVDEEEQRLARVESGIDVHALESDLKAAQRLLEAGQQLVRLEAGCAAASAERERLCDERYSRLAGAVVEASKQLGEAYRELTGGAGTAYLSYTLERQLLFTEGVTLHVRPGDAARWRPFASLSGGQQALGALALSLALQVCFPSPFYFMDEIDAALDTSHAARLAAYLVARTHQHHHHHQQQQQQQQGTSVHQPSRPEAAQYLVVSHKPAVFERAACLLGVYGMPEGDAGAAVMHFGV